jgi:hypothetical protein
MQSKTQQQEIGITRKLWNRKVGIKSYGRKCLLSFVIPFYLLIFSLFSYFFFPIPLCLSILPPASPTLVLPSGIVYLFIYLFSSLSVSPRFISCSVYFFLLLLQANHRTQSTISSPAGCSFSSEVMKLCISHWLFVLYLSKPHEMCYAEAI